MIRTNLITGFLGVGKTTLIRHLLQQRPASERWAVLVNEFGDIGIDGALLDKQGVSIHEVAGGCLCCIAAPAFTVGLNRLIREQRPDHILIEPSGLGHPAQVLQQLASPLYRNILSLQATLCVMDPRHLSSPRHREHPNFQDQIHLADALIANKADRCSDADIDNFHTFAATLRPRKQRLGLVEYGRVDPDWLQLERSNERQPAFPEAHAFLLDAGLTEEPADSSDWLLIEGKSDGYYRASWRMAPDNRFIQQSLVAYLDQLGIDRIKGLFHCTDRNLGYNRSTDRAELSTLDQLDESCLQLIHHAPIDAVAINRQLNNLIQAMAAAPISGQQP